MKLFVTTIRIVHLNVFSLLFILVLHPIQGYAQTEELPVTTITFEHDLRPISFYYYSSESLAEENTQIDHAVIVTHGTLRNGATYFTNMMSALGQRPELVDRTVVIAPQFITEEDVNFHGVNESFPFWSSAGWTSGSTSGNDEPQIRISSFEVLDTLIMRAINVFPSISTLVFTGHSAGGQLTNTYTAVSPVFEILCMDYGISSKSIVSNPTKYVYMTSERHIRGTDNQFRIPDTDCEDYNEWSFGLEDLFIYPDRSGAAKIRKWAGEREMVYLLGGQDNVSDAGSVSCRSLIQGEHRLERGIIYYNHILSTYGDEAENNHRLVIIPDLGHDHFLMYNSNDGVRELFDRPPVSNCNDRTTFIDEIQPIDDYSIFPNPSRDEIYINGPQKYRSIEFYDVLGKRLRAVEISPNTNRIGLSNIKAHSLIFYRLNLVNDKVKTGKIIIQ